MSVQGSNEDEHACRYIDLNCDVGESLGANIIGNDDMLIPLVSSANIACGGHGGDVVHTTNAVRVAIKSGVQIGAHPSFPDTANFGRIKMSMSAVELRETLMTQLDYLSQIVDRENGSIAYVKPHGALYHACSDEQKTAEVFLESVIEFDRGLAILGQPGTLLEASCREKNVCFVREAFADRRYLKTGRLVPRTQAGAVIQTEDEICEQAVSIALGRAIATESNHCLKVSAESICIHGDSDRALFGLKQICSAFANSRVVVRRF